MKSKEWQQILQMVGLVSQVGLTIIATIGVAFVIGRFLDRLLGVTFFLTPIFIILGVASGFMSVYRMIIKFFEKPKKDD